MNEEIKSNSAELSDDEAANVSGGVIAGNDGGKMSGVHVCEHCGKSYEYVTSKRSYIPKCPYCHYNPMTKRIENPDGPGNALGMDCL